MKILPIVFFSLATCNLLTSCKQVEDTKKDDASTETQTQKEKPIQHLKLPDITSQDKAIEVMRSTTDKLKSKTKLDAAELGEIHIITYSLEKAIAYFTEKSTGDQQAAAKKMAEVVEEVHLNSENNRKEKTKAALNEYFQLEAAFSKGF